MSALNSSRRPPLSQPSPCSLSWHPPTGWWDSGNCHCTCSQPVSGITPLLVKALDFQNNQIWFPLPWRMLPPPLLSYSNPPHPSWLQPSPDFPPTSIPTDEPLQIHLISSSHTSATWLVQKDCSSNTSTRQERHKSNPNTLLIPRHFTPTWLISAQRRLI